MSVSHVLPDICQEDYINGVINKFDMRGFSRNGAMSYMGELQEEWKEQYDVLPTGSSSIRALIRRDLKCLLKAIQEHTEKEFVLLLETFDHKYGHWNSLHYILTRWYWMMKDEKIDRFEWYKQMGKINDETAGKTRYCSDLVKQMVTHLE